MAESRNLHHIARAIFAEVLSEVDAARALKRAVRIQDAQLHIAGNVFDLRRFNAIYSVALGKAARPMAKELSEILGSRLTGGVISTTTGEDSLKDSWRVFTGGHPVPNEASIAAARAAKELLREANNAGALVIFLVSGGGSAMMEMPVDESITLNDLQTTNRVLVNCGATIGEVNLVRQKLSRIKAGGLSRLAPNAEQVTLIVSDTNADDETSVASGVTYSPSISPRDMNAQVESIVSRYQLAAQLPASVTRILKRDYQTAKPAESQIINSHHHVLLDNRHAVEAARGAAHERGFVVETVDDYVETDVEQGCVALVARLLALRARTPPEQIACLISGGEFRCRVQGDGTGGRNAEAALRCAIKFDELASGKDEARNHLLLALHAGTDGIDGNSPAAGAIADSNTLQRARIHGLDAHDFLARSDAYTFFARLGDALITGATGTNVRDVRVMLAQSNV